MIAPPQVLRAAGRTPRAAWAAGGLAIAIGIGLAVATPGAIAAATGAAAVIAAIVIIFAEPMFGVGITLFFAPFGPLENIYFGLPVESGQILLGLTVAAWLARALVTEPGRYVDAAAAALRRPIGVALMAFIGAGVLSFFAAQSFELWLKECIKWAQVLLMYVLVASERDARKRAVVVAALLLSLAFQAALGLAQFGLLGYGPKEFTIVKDQLWRAHGTLEQPNPYGGYVGMLWLVTLGVGLAVLSTARRDGRWSPTRLVGGGVALTIALVGLGGVVASWSRGAWLGAGAAAVAVLIVAFRRPLAAALAVAAITALVLALNSANALPESIRARLTDFTSQLTTFDVRGVNVNEANYAVIERLAHWQAAANMIDAQPYLGVGFGNYAAAYDRFRLIAWPIALGHAHNYYLNIWAETGVLGLAAYAVLWTVVFAQTIKLARTKRSRAAALIALGLLGAWVHLSAHHLFDNLYVANTFLLVGALMGLLEALSREVREFGVSRR